MTAGTGWGKQDKRFMRLKEIWRNNDIHIKTKILAYKTLVKPVLLQLDACETRKMNKGDERKIGIFQSKCLRRILKPRRQEKAKNQEVLQQR